MTARIIKIGNYTEIESLKKYILQKLNLIDHKKDCIPEFYERLQNYIDRNKSLKITMQFERDKLEKDLKFKLSLLRFQQPFPNNFEIDNPHNRWIYDPISMTEEEAKKEELDFEKSYKEKLLSLNQFLDRLEQIGNGQVFIKDNSQ